MGWSIKRQARTVWHLLPPALRQKVSEVRRRGEPPVGGVDFGDFRRVKPIRNDFGFSRGGPVDRHYIEAFLDRQRTDIHGRVLEVGDNTYTRAFGGAAVKVSDVLNVRTNPTATFVGDLADGSFLPTAAFDCVILAQTLHLIFDFGAALRTVERILAPGGVLLLTVPGISNIEDGEWGPQWHYNFTEVSVRQMTKTFLPKCDTEVASFGNVLGAVAFLHGLGASELTTEELAVVDPAYGLIYTARARKRF